MTSNLGGGRTGLIYRIITPDPPLIWRQKPLSQTFHTRTLDNNKK